MSTLPEQFSAVSKSQVETQINFFQNYAARALESAQKILALNLAASRASMEKSSAAVVDILAAKDPRDLFALTKRTQESIDGLLAYNRELVAIAIATGASAVPADKAEKAVEPVAQAKPEAPALAQVKPAPVIEPEPAAPELVAPVAEPEVAAPVVASVTPAPPPAAKVKPIAKAVAKVAPKAVAAKSAAAPFPVAAANKIVVTGIKPVEASPPPTAGKPAVTQQPPQQPQQQQQQLSLTAAKAKKKK